MNHVFSITSIPYALFCMLCLFSWMDSLAQILDYKQKNVTYHCGINLVIVFFVLSFIYLFGLYMRNSVKSSLHLFTFSQSSSCISMLIAYVFLLSQSTDHIRITKMHLISTTELLLICLRIMDTLRKGSELIISSIFRFHNYPSLFSVRPRPPSVFSERGNELKKFLSHPPRKVYLDKWMYMTLVSRRERILVLFNISVTGSMQLRKLPLLQAYCDWNIILVCVLSLIYHTIVQIMCLMWLIPHQ